jgi:hypothetical protein
VTAGVCYFAKATALIERRYVRLKAGLIGEVEVLFRYTLSGL